jgi:hypothetical protein
MGHRYQLIGLGKPICSRGELFQVIPNHCCMLVESIGGPFAEHCNHMPEIHKGTVSAAAAEVGLGPYRGYASSRYSLDTSI